MINKIKFLAHLWPDKTNERFIKIPKNNEKKICNKNLVLGIKYKSTFFNIQFITLAEFGKITNLKNNFSNNLK